MILSFLVVAVVVFALRLLPAGRWPGDGSDAGYHLLLRRVLRENGLRMPARVEALALDEKQAYPWLYHTLLALLPERLLLARPALVSCVSDALLAAIAMCVAAVFAGDAFVTLLTPMPLLAGLLVATSPALLAAGVGPRSYEITPRPVGELLFSAAAAGCGATYAGVGTGWLVVGAFCLGLGLLSSKFTLQVAVFCLPVMALVSWSVLPLLLLVGGFAAALLLSGGRYGTILSAQVQHLDIYRRRIQFDHEEIQHRNDTSMLRASIGRTWKTSASTWAAFLTTLAILEKSTLFLGFARNLVWLLAVASVIAAWHGGAFLASPIRCWLAAWTIAPVVPFLLTSLRKFLFLGEAERYLEYAVLPAAVLAAHAAMGVSLPLGIALVAGLVLWTVLFLAYTYRRMKSRSARRSAGEDLLVEYLVTLPEGRRILSLSLNLTFRLVWRLRHLFLAAADSVVWRRDYDLLFWRYPWISTDLGWWIREKKAELLIVDRRALAALPDVAAKYDLSPYPVAYSNDVYEVRRLA